MNDPIAQADLFAPGWPPGLAYELEFLPKEEEVLLLERIASLTLHEARYLAFTAKRRIASFGAEYDFQSNQLHAAPPLPDFLLPLRARVAAWAKLAAERFTHALITEYRPGTALGWHRDTPNFGIVTGVSLRTACRMRFRPYPHRRAQKRSDKKGFDLLLEPRSVYAFREDVRWRWQHSVPPTPDLRYSITFRTLSPGVLPKDMPPQGITSDS